MNDTLNITISHGLTESQLALPVRHIRVTFVAPGYGIEPTAHKYTHAVIYLLTGDVHSIELNMGSPSAINSEGRLIIRYRDFQLHRNYIRNWTFAAAPGLQVQHFLHLIEQNRRHKYIYHPSGVGCRHWV